MSRIKYKKGLTLVELLVTIGIATVLLAITLFDYGTFNDKVALSSAGQEMAIAIKQAQIYGLSVKEVGIGTGNFNSAYGIYFNPGCNSGVYYVFADTNSNKKFDVGAGGGGCGTPDTAGELVEKFTLRNNVTISAICNVQSGTTTCPPSAAVRSMHVTFLRPNPDALINFANNGGSILFASEFTGKVRLTSPKGLKTQDIVIENTGQISLQ